MKGESRDERVVRKESREPGRKNEPMNALRMDRKEVGLVWRSGEADEGPGLSVKQSDRVGGETDAEGPRWAQVWKGRTWFHCRSPSSHRSWFPVRPVSTGTLLPLQPCSSSFSGCLSP